MIAKKMVTMAILIASQAANADIPPGLPPANTPEAAQTHNSGGITHNSQNDSCSFLIS